MQRELEFSPVRCDEPAAAALVLQIELHQRPQVLRPPGGRPVDAARVQLRHIELEPVNPMTSSLTSPVSFAQQSSTVPIQIRANQELVIDVAGRFSTHVEATMTDCSAAKLVAFPHKHEIASGSGRDVVADETREEARPEVEMNPGAPA